jgi:AbrB family looped-hinge helix DNA binding protein
MKVNEVITVSSDGGFAIPKSLQEALGVKPGDQFKVKMVGEQIVITPKQQVRDEAWQELLGVMGRVHEKNKNFTEDEVTQDVLNAIAELREEEYAKQKKP